MRGRLLESGRFYSSNIRKSENEIEQAALTTGLCGQGALLGTRKSIGVGLKRVYCDLSGLGVLAAEESASANAN